MKVLVLGATGFVGYPIAQAYVRAGHDVYGYTRSADKAKELQVNEITPIIADKPEGWLNAAKRMDLIIDCSPTLGPDFCRQNIALANKAGEGRPSHLKLGFLFVSGTWNYGNAGPQEWKDERGAEFGPDTISAWRVAIEEEIVTGSPNLFGTVVRPGFVYGNSGGFFDMLFGPAAAGAASPNKTWSWPATPGHRYETVHRDDFADFVLRAGENLPITKGVVFDAVNNASESVEDVLLAIDACAGDGVKHTYATDKIEGIYAGFDTQSMTKPSLGRAMLGWVPKKKSLVDGMPIWWAGWKASKA